jgi:hypothetical protein
VGGSSDVSTLVLVWAVSMGVLLVVVVLTLVGYKSWVRRRAGRLAPGAWSLPCVDPTWPQRWQVFVVDSSGVAMRGGRRRAEQSWGWDQIVGAEPAQVRPAAALIAHRGLALRLTNGQTVELLFPSRTTLRYPPAMVDRAVAEIRAHLDAVAEPGSP